MHLKALSFYVLFDYFESKFIKLKEKDIVDTSSKTVTWVVV